MGFFSNLFGTSKPRQFNSLNEAFQAYNRDELNTEQRDAIHKCFQATRAIDSNPFDEVINQAASAYEQFGFVPDMDTLVQDHADMYQAHTNEELEMRATRLGNLAAAYRVLISNTITLCGGAPKHMMNCFIDSEARSQAAKSILATR